MSQLTPAPTIEATPPGRRQEVLQLLGLGSARTERLLAAAYCGEIDMQGLYHARRGSAFVGAAWGQKMPGRTAFCWPAMTAASEPEETAEMLQTAVDHHLDVRGIVVTQAILSPRDVLNAVRLTRRDYEHLADLDYLVSRYDHFPEKCPAGELELLSSRQFTNQHISKLVERTYRDTLDCTELNGLRSIDDVLTGYRQTGVYRQDWWIIGQYQGHDVGCVLLADHPEHDQCELMYLGIVPEMRGRGWGQQLTQGAQWLARCASRQRIVLAVDDANWPARRLYESTGFELWDRRSVYVRTALSNGTGPPSSAKQIDHQQCKADETPQ